MDNQFENLLENWHRRVRLSQYAHYAAAKRVRNTNQILGVQAVIIPTVVGTTLFANIDSISTSILLTLGMLCLFSAVISALQTFFRLDSLAELHRTAAARYGAIRREIELQLSINDLSEEMVRTEAERIVSQMDAIAQESPSVPNVVWHRVESSLVKSGESYSRTLTKEESIIANLKSYGPLPVEFLAKIQGVTHSEILYIVEALKENHLIEVQEGKVSLTPGGRK